MTPFCAHSCRYLHSVFGEELKSRGIVIGYDHRASGTLNSKGFAEITARVLLNEGIPVHMLHNEVRSKIYCLHDFIAGYRLTSLWQPQLGGDSLCGVWRPPHRQCCRSHGDSVTQPQRGQWVQSILGERCPDRSPS